jgi:hypothetical protein
VNLNSSLAATITKLSCGSSCVSDAVFMTMQISKSVHAMSLNDYSNLFESEAQISELQRLWGLCAKRITTFAHLALLFDPRPEYIEFVTPEPLIVGDPAEKTLGNTAVLYYCIAPSKEALHAERDTADASVLQVEPSYSEV